MKLKSLFVAASVLISGTVTHATLTAQTSEAAVRNFLMTSPRPDRVGTHAQVERVLIVADTPRGANKTTTQKVYYKVEVTLSADYVARRLAYLQRERTRVDADDARSQKAIDQSIKLMKRNRQIVQGRALVKKTPFGWEVLDIRSINSRLDSWALNVYYTGGL